jgi:hypothetical protein
MGSYKHRRANGVRSKFRKSYGLERATPKRNFAQTPFASFPVREGVAPSASEESLAQTSRRAPERVRARRGLQATVTCWAGGRAVLTACVGVRKRPDAPTGPCIPISTCYTYRSCSRIILLGYRAISILKRPKNRVFQYFFVAQRPLTSLRGTLNYANLCTLPKRRQLTSCFDCLVVK